MSAGYLELIEQDLVDAARRRTEAGGSATVVRLRPRRSIRSLLLAAALALIVAGSAMAGTLYVLRGSVIPAPAERDAGPGQTVEPGTAQVLPMRAADPGGGPAFALRVARSRTGLVCSTVGQVQGDEFGLIGLDRRFRSLDEGVVDGCGLKQANGVSLLGARVLDAPRRDEVRTVVNGVGGEGLARAVLVVRGRREALAVGPGGAFVRVLRGYPEDSAIVVRLKFADGRVEVRSLGASPFVVPDPLGGPAWRIDNLTIRRDNCVAFSTARPFQRPDTSSAACGEIGYPDRSRGYYFATRRLSRSSRPGLAGRFDWRRAPRTAVWGQAGEDVRRVEVVEDGRRRTVPWTTSRSFLALFPADVRPAAVRVVITMRDGTVRIHDGDAHLTQTRRP